jgi:ABC-2 type transport system ATP-binding protein
MNASDSIVIQTEGLTKTFKSVNALTELNLRVPKNSIFGFLGPNGAGKTTTIKLLLGLSRPTSGSASIFGMDIVKDSTRIRRHIGYLAQEPHYYEHLTARQTLRFAARFFYTSPQKAIEDRIQNTLELVGLDDKADRPIKGFSGGERQRLGIAQAQINFPDLLILDEPAASLDPMGRRDVLEVMERLRKHTTIFYSTHILSDVQRVSDTVAILKKGQLVAEAPIETLLAGSSGTVYSITVMGHSDGLQVDLASLPWVSSVSTPSNNGRTTWQVTVTDEATAESQLLPRLICDEHLAVVEFGRKKYELEEIFMNIVEGGEHDR